jgi:ketosteroid isomerase-like protein
MAAEASAVADEIRALSAEKFQWAADGQIDRFADLLDDNLAFVHLTGQISSKQKWIAQLRAGAYGYRKMQFIDSDVHDHGDTAVLVGRVDILVASGHTWRLAVTEVYVNKQDSWKLVSAHACSA